MKRLIKSNWDSIGEEYTSLVSMELDPIVEEVIESDPSDITRSMLDSAVDTFFKEYNLLPLGTLDELDPMYDKDKGRIYLKYRPFVDKCVELLEYYNRGTNSAKNLYEKQLLRRVDNNFPYGWKRYGR